MYSFIWTDISFLLEEEIREAALFYSCPKGNASFLPRGERLGSGIWIVGSALCACPRRGWTCHRFRIAWLRSVVWMDRRASRAQEMLKSPVLTKHVSLSFAFDLCAIMLAFFPLMISQAFYFWSVRRLSPLTLVLIFLPTQSGIR